MPEAVSHCLAGQAAEIAALLDSLPGGQAFEDGELVWVGFDDTAIQNSRQLCADARLVSQVISRLVRAAPVGKLVTGGTQSPFHHL